MGLPAQADQRTHNHYYNGWLQQSQEAKTVGVWCSISISQCTHASHVMTEATALPGILYVYKQGTNMRVEQVVDNDEMNQRVMSIL